MEIWVYETNGRSVQKGEIMAVLICKVYYNWITRKYFNSFINDVDKDEGTNTLSISI